MHFDVTLTLKFSPESDAMLARILEQLQTLTTEIHHMSEIVTQLEARVAQLEEVGAQVVERLITLKEELDAAGTDPAALSALSERFATQITQLQNALLKTDDDPSNDPAAA